MFFRKLCHLFDDMEIYGTARQTTDDSTVRRMPIICCRTETTDTYSESVILLVFLGNSAYTNAPQYYAVRTLRVL
jgi:hypothetical protein